MDELEKVTRFEVIDHREGVNFSARAFQAYGCSVKAYLQDDGRTLKIFLTGGGR